ncbi:LysR substrate-binding domain-containing protein [Marinomonas transparens]|uniref:LysR family transcriptional regulator n=1 Tax=Marinomonas transparens TaxID=2795388 RepID=A0A934JTP1_9GAMM|nr:LysR substrate-binding domain-containing protein [Marinomonas transparens]MBJ7539774.1 LysR family transcriptional regulator [Marinomonas transparens]
MSNTPLRLPPLKSLLAFRHAARSLSFKDAAGQLHVTQAAISQQIKTLEETLGVPLFERHTRQISLTHEGQYLFEHAEKAFELLETGVKGIIDDPNPNTLVISTLPSFASRWLVSRLGHFQEKEKDINIHLSPSLSLASFSDGNLDLSIRLGQGTYAGLRSDLLFDEFLLPVCHPALLNNTKEIKQQLAALPVITDGGPDLIHVWPEFQRYLGSTNTPLKSHLHVSDSTILIEALLSGQGITMARFSLVYELIEKGQLICPLPIYVKSYYSFYLVAPAPHFKHHKVTTFISWLKGETKTIEASWQAYLKAHPELEKLEISYGKIEDGC